MKRKSINIDSSLTWIYFESREPVAHAYASVAEITLTFTYYQHIASFIIVTSSSLNNCSNELIIITDLEN